jgi:hypothetical protein
MKRIIFTLSISIIFSISCQKEDFDFNEIVGKWQLTKGYSLMLGGFFTIDPKDQRIEEYTGNSERILYDYLGNETARCGYNITDSTITIFGENLNGNDWEFEYKYWFKQDTLVIHQDGGFEYYNEFFIRIK